MSPVPAPTGCGCPLIWSPTQKRLFCPAGCGSLDAPACACKAYVAEKERLKGEALFEVMTHRLSDPDLRLVLAKFEESAPLPSWLSQLRDEDADAFEQFFPTWEEFHPVRKRSPALTCTICGFTVAKYVCLGQEGSLKQHQALCLLQVGFYERVWCCYRWGCADAPCSVMRGGMLTPDESASAKDRALLCCLSSPECISRSDEPGKEGCEMATLEWLDTVGPPSNWEIYRRVNA